MISLDAVSIAFTSALLLDIEITWDYLVIAYLATYVVYAYNRLKELKIDFITNLNGRNTLQKALSIYPLSYSFRFLLLYFYY